MSGISGSPVPKGPKSPINPIDSDPVGEGPSGTVATPGPVVANIGREAFTLNQEPQAPAKLEGRVTKGEPKASMDKDGIVTVEFGDRTYTYHTEGEPAAFGGVNTIYKEHVPSNVSNPYVLRIPYEGSPKSFAIQQETFAYQKELHKDGTLPNVEPPGHLLTYTNPKTGKVQSAIFAKEYNRIDMFEFVYESEFNSLPGESRVELGMQVATGSIELAKQRSTYISLRLENVGVEVTPEGEVRASVRDFDKVQNLPKVTKDSDIFKDVEACDVLISKLGEFASKGYARSTIPAEEYDRLFDFTEALKFRLIDLGNMLEEGINIPEDYIEYTVALIDLYEEALGKIQSFQLGATLYEMMVSPHEMPYETDKYDNPIIPTDPKSKDYQTWVDSRKEHLQKNFKALGLPEDHELVEGIMGLLHPNPGMRTALV